MSLRPILLLLFASTGVFCRNLTTPAALPAKDADKCYCRIYGDWTFATCNYCAVGELIEPLILVGGTFTISAIFLVLLFIRKRVQRRWDRTFLGPGM